MSKSRDQKLWRRALLIDICYYLHEAKKIFMIYKFFKTYASLQIKLKEIIYSTKIQAFKKIALQMNFLGRPKKKWKSLISCL